MAFAPGAEKNVDNRASIALRKLAFAEQSQEQSDIAARLASVNPLFGGLPDCWRTERSCCLVGL